jgi:hypothetical protein
LAVRKYPPTEGTLAFSNRQYYFPEKTKVFPAPLGLVPAQTKKKKKLGQFSGSKPSGLSPQRALFKFREASPSVGPPIYLSANILNFTVFRTALKITLLQ